MVYWIFLNKKLSFLGQHYFEIVFKYQNVQHSPAISMMIFECLILNLLIRKYRQQNYYFFFFFFLFRATPMAYRNSQARGWVGAAAASLCHSHSNMTYTTYSSWQCQIPDPLSKASNWTCTLMDTGWIRFHCATRVTPNNLIFLPSRSLWSSCMRNHYFNWIFKNIYFLFLKSLLS